MAWWQTVFFKTLPRDDRYISEKLRPQLWHWHYLAMRPIVQFLRHHARAMPTGGEVLDIGCGDKPYRALFPQAKTYVGVDHELGGRADVVAEAWDLPFKTHRFDLVLATEVLEHVKYLEKAVTELKRVVKPGGLILVTVPFLFPEHGQPDDYWRLTRDGLRFLFADEEIMEVRGANGTAGTLATLTNYAFHILPLIPDFILSPFYIINNLWGLLGDGLVRILNRWLPFELVHQYYERIWQSWSRNYMIAVRRNVK